MPLPRRMMIAALMSLLVHGLGWWVLERGWAQRVQDKRQGVQRQAVQNDLQVRLILSAPQESEPAAPTPAATREASVPSKATGPVKGAHTAPPTRPRSTADQQRPLPAQAPASGPTQDMPQRDARGTSQAGTSQAGTAEAGAAPAQQASLPTTQQAGAQPGAAEEPLEARLGRFARQHGTRLERDTASAPLSPAPRGNSMGAAMDKALKLAGSGWREYRGQHGESVVRFSAGTCTRIKPLPDHEQRHLNKTVEVVGCQD